MFKKHSKKKKRNQTPASSLNLLYRFYQKTKTCLKSVIGIGCLKVTSSSHIALNSFSKVLTANHPRRHSHTKQTFYSLKTPCIFLVTPPMRFHAKEEALRSKICKDGAYHRISHPHLVVNEFLQRKLLMLTGQCETTSDEFSAITPKAWVINF